MGDDSEVAPDIRIQRGWESGALQGRVSGLRIARYDGMVEEERSFGRCAGLTRLAGGNRPTATRFSRKVDVCVAAGVPILSGGEPSTRPADAMDEQARPAGRGRGPV